MIFDTVRTVLQETLGVENITPDMRFAEDLEVDSLDAVEMAMALEDELGIDEITDEELKSLVTVQDLIDLLSDKVSQKKN